MKQMFGAGVLMSMGFFNGARASASSAEDCIDFAGTWEGYREPNPLNGDQLADVTQDGCDVTIYDRNSPSYVTYTNYTARGDRLECPPGKAVYLPEGIEGPGEYCQSYRRESGEGNQPDDFSQPSWPTELVYHEALSPEEQPTLTAVGTWEGMAMVRVYKPFPCPRPSTDCYRH